MSDETMEPVSRWLLTRRASVSRPACSPRAAGGWCGSGLDDDSSWPSISLDALLLPVAQVAGSAIEESDAVRCHARASRARCNVSGYMREWWCGGLQSRLSFSKETNRSCLSTDWVLASPRAQRVLSPGAWVGACAMQGYMPSCAW